ncbi:uncharacterized protein ova [Venturia canescens]|uniref:uncharacterized protein ova n=1 Tax=Venturia canescens TaxID=32260 RepID=UPI001C9D4EA9|nr:uncharacterized protein LOC122406664 [Venturia canescens]XP_043268193.1 uncharacterized protein LOC122406664 [Venturia canescens]XP_043268203.1 uncharacterized protein LOC122406664 [Venturia canescens]XP_043268212.1 uncharacterized protein LOC122406664 [Venturia canescens]XP_043268219.1 uncharacterized protein LOC122406664 [Venturia canescens]XP_043268228.1 uncharacterized protein LOC122406664 [Venturia canescens]XP_043268236.1 uncharacterized protein LOC122406664 [Venturia canescens]
MRFLAAQEDGYGVGLVQDRLPDYADERMMAATGDTEPEELQRVEEGSMISNLPLLFADGYPTSLDKISLVQLERFIAFMVQCSLGHDTAEVISEPQWWPKEVRFTNPLIRPKKLNDSWMANLKKLVFRCYTYHRSEYLLRFCSYLAQYPRDKLYYVNNWDSTTSLYHKVTGKLLVTFRNENMNYDKIVESPRRSLLPQHGCSSGFPNKTKQQQQKKQSHSLVVIQPPSDEIYLCDNCDAEFVGLEKMKAHEKTCGEQSTPFSRSQTPNEISPATELPQNQFLEYFRLFSSESQVCKRSEAPRPFLDDPVILTENRTSRRVRGSINLTRCPAIPFSSPAGLAMAKKSKMMTEGTQQERLERIERYMHAPALSRSVRPKWLDRLVEYNRWVVTYKSLNRDRPLTDDTQQQFTHEYKFNARRHKLVLSIRSQLLYMSCKPIYVSVERLSEAQIAELRRDPTKYKCPVGGITSRVRLRPGPKSLPKCRRADRSSLTLKGKKLDVERRRMSESTMLHDTRTNAVLNSKLSTEILEDFAVITPIEETSSQSSNRSNDVDKLSKKNIVFVDLCSSDEENETVPFSADENRDPLRRNSSTMTNNKSSLVKNLTNNKFRAKSCVRASPDSTSDWLRDNVLTDDNDKCPGKCHPNVVLETCTQFSPIFKPTP